MKNTFLAVFMIFSMITGGCDRAAKVQKRKEDASEQKWQNAITVFAKKHGALIDWESNIPKRDGLTSPFSIDLSRALIPTNGQPVVLLLELKDVVERNNKYRAKFDGFFYENQNFELCLDVECTPEQADRLLKISEGKKWSFESYAVVTKIENISRVDFEVRGTTEGTPAGDPPELEVNYSTDLFIAKGTFVDVITREDVISNE